MRLLRIILIALIISIIVIPAQAQGCATTTAANTPAALVEHANNCNLADDYEQALADLNQALALDSNYAPAAYIRAITYMNMGNYERALVDLQYALDLRYEEPQNVYTLIGWSHFNLDDYEGAIAAFEQAIALDPTDDFPYWGLGDSYRALGEFDRAVEYYHQHIDLAGENAAPVVRAYVAGYEGDPLPTQTTGRGRTNWEILGVMLLMGIGVVMRFRFARNIWQRNMEKPRKSKAQQVYEQTRDLEQTYEREKIPVDFAPADAISVATNHPDNSVVRAIRDLEAPLNQPPPEKIGPSGVGGINPAVATYVWETLAQKLPQNCNWLVYGRVTLVHPECGLLFCIALPGSIVALRLPEAQREAVIAAVPNSQQFQLKNGKAILAQRFGKDWLFVGNKAHQWVRAAYDYTGELGRHKLTREDYY